MRVCAEGRTSVSTFWWKDLSCTTNLTAPCSCSHGTSCGASLTQRETCTHTKLATSFASCHARSTQKVGFSHLASRFLASWQRPRFTLRFYWLCMHCVRTCLLAAREKERFTILAGTGVHVYTEGKIVVSALRAQHVHSQYHQLTKLSHFESFPAAQQRSFSEPTQKQQFDNPPSSSVDRLRTRVHCSQTNTTQTPPFTFLFTSSLSINREKTNTHSMDAKAKKAAKKAAKAAEAAEAKALGLTVKQLRIKKREDAVRQRD